MEVGAAVFASIKRKLHYFGEHSSSSIDSNTSVIDKSNRNIVNITVTLITTQSLLIAPKR